MKGMVANLLILIILYETVSVESGIILEKLASVKGHVKCKLHKIGNVISKHQHVHDPCSIDSHDAHHHEEHNEIEPTELPKIINDPTTTTQSSVPDIDIRLGESDSSATPTARPIDGRRIISAISNCPEGSRYDGVMKKCREVY